MDGKRRIMLYLVSALAGGGLTAIYFLSGLAPSDGADGLLRCSMRGGAMDGREYSFIIDPIHKTADWAEGGKLEVGHVDDLRIHTGAKVTIPGWPDHDEVGFNFNRATLKVEGILAKAPSREEIESCKQKNPEDFFCYSPIVTSSSTGSCSKAKKLL
jgi:hypothetical protein